MVLTSANGGSLASRSRTKLVVMIFISTDFVESFTSLGALGTGTVKCLNAAAGYLKKAEEA